MKIWAHTLVKNEERYLWFAVESVIDYVDRLLLWDTGSTDKTPEIIKLLKKRYGEKIDVKIWGEVTPQQYTVLRQKMLDKTKSDWLLILDGDEVWWTDGIKQLVRIIYNKSDLIESIVNGYYSVVGDIYHFQDESQGRYVIDNEAGHITIRALSRNIPGLYTAKPHGQHGYFDENGCLVQERSKRKRYHMGQKTYLHFTHLVRSNTVSQDSKVPKRAGKRKFIIGHPFPNDFYYPEVLFRPKPDIVPSPWERMNSAFVLRSRIEQPMRYIKNAIIKPKVGY